MLSKGMSKVHRIAFQKLLMLVRLVIVVSLASYTLPSVSLAMHGNASSSYAAALPIATAAAHEMMAAHAMHDMKAADAPRHDHHPTDQASKADGKTLKQECCNDSCLSAAIVADVPSILRDAPATVKLYSNDAFVFGEYSPLQRPPSIRT